MSLQTLISIQCNDDNPKTWKHIVETNGIQEKWESCDNHKEGLRLIGIKILVEEPLK